MTPDIRIGTLPLSSVEAAGDLTITAQWPGGGWEAAWSMLLPEGERPWQIVKNATGSVSVGGCPLLAGRMTEVDWAGGKFVLSGSIRRGENAAAIDGSGNPTTVPDTAISAAATRGATDWTLPASISAAAFATGDAAAAPNTVDDLLTAWALENGKRIYVDPYRRVLAGTDPTSPTYHVYPGADALSWTTQAEADRVVGRWVDASDASHLTSVGTGEKEAVIDLQSKGPLDVTRATATLNAILAQSTSGSWTGSVAVAPQQIMGNPHPAQVVADIARGCMVRFHGQRDPRNPALPYIDVVIASVEWVVDGALKLTPAGLVARSFADVVAAAGGTVGVGAA